MKRRRRGGAAPQAEACDVWLDTAAQSVVAKPKVPAGVLERKQALGAFMQAGASQPGSKQTTIPAFFSTQTGEKDKENSRPSPFSPNRDCKVKGVSAATSPVKILALPGMEEAQKRSFGGEVQVTPQARAQKALALPPPLLDSWLPHVEPHSEGEGSCGVGEDSCSFSFTQDSQGNRVIAHRNKSHGFAGETVSASSRVTSAGGINKPEGQALPEEPKTSCHFLQRPGANWHKKPEQGSSVNSLIDFTDTENINPATMRDDTWAGGVCTSPLCRAEPLRAWNQNAGAGSAKERRGSEWGPSSPCRQLFTQDSEGNRVIAHCCQNLPSPLKDLGSSHRQLPNSACKGCSSEAVKRSSSTPEQWSDVGYDLLFTQDSEGNRVIKH
ncbi:aurora kinase A- and ninein-interacting protein [Porphyrio hochstetteri]